MNDFNFPKTVCTLESNSNNDPKTDNSSRLFKTTYFQKDSIASISDANFFSYSKTMSALPVLTTKGNIAVAQLLQPYNQDSKVSLCCLTVTFAYYKANHF